MSSNQWAARRRAFTLFEMILAISMFTMLLGSIYLFYRTSLGVRERGNFTARQTQLARVVLNQIATDIRQAYGFAASYAPGLKGTPDRLELLTTAVPGKELMELRTIDDEPLPGQFDLTQVLYELRWDEEELDENGDPICLGLYRVVTKTLNQPVQVEREQQILEDLFAPEVQFLRFWYFDGRDWVREWRGTEGNSLPQAVRVTIGFDKVPPDQEERMLKNEDETLDLEKLEPNPWRHSMIVLVPGANSFFGSRLTRIMASLESPDEEGGTGSLEGSGSNDLQGQGPAGLQGLDTQGLDTRGLDSLVNTGGQAGRKP
jgi:type II secretory pathway component PulJ